MWASQMKITKVSVTALFASSSEYPSTKVLHYMVHFTQNTKLHSLKKFLAFIAYCITVHLGVLAQMDQSKSLQYQAMEELLRAQTTHCKLKRQFMIASTEDELRKSRREFEKQEVQYANQAIMPWVDDLNVWSDKQRLSANARFHNSNWLPKSLESWWKDISREWTRLNWHQQWVRECNKCVDFCLLMFS